MTDKRLIMLDTETTGIKPEEGHRVIEIGAVVLSNRQLTDEIYHQYINPEFAVEQEALQVHGISNEFLQDKPKFHEVMVDFMTFIEGAVLVMHNAPFDVKFLNNELRLCGYGQQLEQVSEVVDSLVIAKQKHPGARNNLDALCKRYGISNAHRTLHGALLDAQILAQVYLAMTGGQMGLNLNQDGDQNDTGLQFDLSQLPALKTIEASQQELQAHQSWVSKNLPQDPFKTS
ncbi:MAG: DNA polymerase III subunit epsilon [Proteobacteria bacterium]|nr:MAG: DNA polymerase III subunit epsilon [Pseudomonadota bacterium]